MNGFQALTLLAFLGTSIAYIQTRWWIINRYLLIRILRPIQLPNADEAASLHHLSQTNAVMLLVFAKKKRDNDGMTSVSPWFGASSLFTALLFLILGALIPYYLTGGSRTPTVQTRASDTCDGLHNYSPNAIQLAHPLYAQCQANVSANKGACNFNTPLVDTRPQLKITLDSRCPFEEGNCHIFKPTQGIWKDVWCKNDNDSTCNIYNKALIIEHPNATPSDYGLNSDGNILKSHRVTCAPVNVEKFRVAEGDRNATVFWVGYEASLHPATLKTH